MDYFFLVLCVCSCFVTAILKTIVSTVSKNIKINFEGQNYVHFEVILSRNVKKKIFGIMASL